VFRAYAIQRGALFRKHEALAVQDCVRFARAIQGGCLGLARRRCPREGGLEFLEMLPALSFLAELRIDFAEAARYGS
jgi:hypothetical protein